MSASLADLPAGTPWYVVQPGGIAAIQHSPAYAGPDRSQALGHLVAILARGEQVLAGERFRPRATDGYVSVGTARSGLPPVPDLSAANALLAAAARELAHDAATATARAEMSAVYL